MNKVMICSSLIVLAFVGCSSSASSIRKVLEADSKTIDGATTHSQVVQAMRAIDLSKCPEDFQDAYTDHIHAWERMAQLEKQANQFVATNNSGQAFLESVVRGFLGDPFGKATEQMAEHRQMEATEKQIQSDLQRTFQRVEKIALKYGVSLPRKPGQ